MTGLTRKYYSQWSHLKQAESEGLGGVVWVYKIGLKRPVIAMAITRKPQARSLSERDRELELEF